MKSLTFRVATALLTFTIGVGVATVWVFGNSRPAIDPVDLNTKSAMLEMVFVVDTTGSMGGLIEGAKQRIWGIVNEVMQSPSHPAVKIGLVAYRDRRDEYVTQVLPLTEDLDKVYATLMDYRAAGGGDTPENVRRALAEGVAKAGWSPGRNELAQIIFLVGDAPPHDDYADEQDTLISADIAVRQGMVVNTIQCGQSSDTQVIWKSIAERGHGQYFAIPQDGGVETIATPYDEQLSQLGAKLGGTYLAFGGGAGEAGIVYREANARKAALMEVAVTDSAAPAARAERAVNKAVNSNAYVGDLLQGIENGSVKLESVKDEDLPNELQNLTPAERNNEVERRLGERREIRNQILELSKKRTDYIAAERKKQTGVKSNGFDVAVSEALKQQLARKGIK